jgi:hypothetical protein
MRLDRFKPVPKRNPLRPQSPSNLIPRRLRLHSLPQRPIFILDNIILHLHVSVQLDGVCSGGSGRSFGTWALALDELVSVALVDSGAHVGEETGDGFCGLLGFGEEWFGGMNEGCLLDLGWRQLEVCNVVSFRLGCRLLQHQLDRQQVPAVCPRTAIR